MRALESIVLRYKLMKDLSLEEYRSLAEFRYQIRQFLGFSEEQVRAAGMEPRHANCFWP